MPEAATQTPVGAAPTAAQRRDPRLDLIREKTGAGERLSLDEGELLFSTPDLWTVLELADAVRRRMHGVAAYYNVNRHFNYTNICALSCKFCEFYRKKGQPGAYTRSIDDARAEARRAVESGATEIHSVGGLHPELPFSYYTDLVRAIKDEARSLGADLHVKAFTAVEVVHLARIAKVYRQADRTSGIRWVLEHLRDAGLDSLPGGGAEVFDDRVHDEAFKGKIRSDVWLDVHRTAHELGLNTNATILYGHIEQRRERLVHMDMLRRAQDTSLARLGYDTRHASPGTESPVITLTRPGTPLPEHIAFSTSRAGHTGSRARRAGYFQTIIPLPFFPDGSDLEHLPGPTGLENLRTLAVARLMLDNIPHVKAFWIMQTLGMAQLMLQCGADDIDGTVVWYDITKVPQGAQADAATHQETTVWDLQRAIREAGFTPVERDSLYRRITREGGVPRVARPE
ncbi:MAG: radical SAM protein [Phycisphaerales bacterium]|nr:radical SAM protein [Phycisphaerales bacterium]